MKQFPIQILPPQREPKWIPWDMIQPHETRAILNHNQTLERLADRHGLPCCEVLAVLQDRRWHRMNPSESSEELLRLVEEFNARLKEVTHE